MSEVKRYKPIVVEPVESDGYEISYLLSKDGPCVLYSDYAALEKRCEEVERENREQARLLGMGAEREATLLGRLAHAPAPDGVRERPITSLAYCARLSTDQVLSLQRIVKEMDAYADALEAAPPQAPDETLKSFEEWLNQWGHEPPDGAVCFSDEDCVCHYMPTRAALALYRNRKGA